MSTKITDFLAIILLLVGVTFLLGLNSSVSIPTYNIGEVSSLEKKLSEITPEQTLTDYPSSTKPMLFLGDILLARNVELLMDINGVDYPWENINQTLQDYDLVVGNFESAMNIPHARTRAFTTRFSTAEKNLVGLKKSGITHLSLANNHTYDFGATGFNLAWSSLEALNIAPFGDPVFPSKSVSISYIKQNNFKIALIGLEAVFSAPSTEILNSILTEAALSSDLQIIYIHWGTEYELNHDQNQRQLAKNLILAGADMIIGHHPHVTQDIEIIDGVLVFYSLGNFIFDQYFSQDVGEGYMLAVSAEAKGWMYNLLPISSLANRSQPSLMTEKEKQQFLTNLAKRSSQELKENINTGLGFIEYPLAVSP